jgi:hypothetical protein
MKNLMSEAARSVKNGEERLYPEYMDMQEDQHKAERFIFIKRVLHSAMLPSRNVKAKDTFMQCLLLL